MKNLLLLLFLFPVLSMGQSDFDSRYFTIEATTKTELPTPALSAFQKKVHTSMYKQSLFSDFTNQQVTSQNYWQSVDMVATTENRQPNARVSLERLQSGFGNSRIYGYQTDGKTRVRNEVYRDQQYYSPIYNTYGPYYRSNTYSPYNFPTERRRAIITIGRDN
ncbi:hypothetical protein [Rasiella sp. SM2506]|uniref:hypothetical protein n=1 Tax=Rasiella sp. SM2506 TaxID=3423914 RepID=UPI003D7BE426